ncbi:MAG TPA: hypothetical protein VK045_06225 [Ornithinicoccus sp.]|nr:hypothetical protein [Ornithinicoccus sp.]
MSITGGMFNSKTNRDDAGDTRTTADGDASGADAPEIDLTTSIPGFDDPDADESGSIVIAGDEGDAWVDDTARGMAVDDVYVADEDVPLDPES